MGPIGKEISSKK